MATTSENIPAQATGDKHRSTTKHQRRSDAAAEKPASERTAAEIPEIYTESSNVAEIVDKPTDAGIQKTASIDEPSKLADNHQLPPEEARFVIRRRKDGAFVVFLDKDLHVRWKRERDVFVDETHGTEPRDVERILARAQTLGAVPVPFLTDEQRETKARFIGEAVALALSGDVDQARRILKDASTFIHAKAIEKARIWTVQGSLASFLLLTTFFTIFAILSSPADTDPLNVHEIAIAAVFGLIGSQFSLLQRLNRLEVAAPAGMAPHVIEAFSRILIGALGGIIMYVVLRAQIFFGFIDHAPSSGQQGVSEQWVTWALVIVAGASERLIPNFMTAIESQTASDPLAEKREAKNE